MGALSDRIFKFLGERMPKDERLELGDNPVDSKHALFFAYDKDRLRAVGILSAVQGELFPLEVKELVAVVEIQHVDENGRLVSVERVHRNLRVEDLGKVGNDDYRANV